MMADHDTMLRNMSRKGFSLVELLVVVAIIGLLSTIAVIAFSSVRSKARDAKRAADIKMIRSALELYYQDNGSFPISTGALQPNSGWTTSNDSSWATFQTALNPYLKLPIDPRQDSAGWPAGGQYAYSYFSQSYGCPMQWYMIIYRPENPTFSPGVTACDGTSFNYGGTVTAGVKMQ